MRKTMLFTLGLLIAMLCLQGLSLAQAAASPTSLQGCLRFTDGHYRLTDSSGAIHTLIGEANHLTHYIGHQVSVTGTETVRTSDTSQQPGVESTAKERPAFRVKTVKDVAPSCTASK